MALNSLMEPKNVNENLGSNSSESLLNSEGKVFSPLNLGITKLDTNKLDEALLDFSKIPLTSIDWPLKVQALMRFSFFKNDFIEAWRLGQILRRTMKDNSETRALEKTALFKQNSCVLEYEYEKSSLRDLLLEAATYRFPERFQNLNSSTWGESFRQWEGGYLTSTSSASTVLYLAEIPSAQLLKGGRCFSSKLLFNKNYKTSKNELSVLIKFFESLETLKSPNSINKKLLNNEVQNKNPSEKGYFNFFEQDNLFISQRAIALLFARALFLEIDLKLPPSEILKRYAQSIPLEVLKILPDSERRFLWKKIKSEKKLSKLEQQDFIISLLLDPKEAEEVEWFELVDWKDISIDKQILIYHQFLKFESLSDNPYLLLSLAQLYWEKEQTKDVFPLLRRLLVLNSDFLSNSEREAALNLASELFSEFLWNETERGAFQASVPAQLWKEFYQKALRELALKGNGRGFEKLISIKNVRKVLRPPYLELLGFIAHRKLLPFKKKFAQGLTHHRVNKDLQLIIDDLATSQFTESIEFRIELRNFRNIVIEYLKKELDNNHGQQNAELLQQLIHTLNDEENTNDQWLSGNQTVRKGILKIGSVSLRKNLVFENPFKFIEPKKIPLLDLIFLPIGFGGERWILE